MEAFEHRMTFERILYCVQIDCLWRAVYKELGDWRKYFDFLTSPLKKVSFFGSTIKILLHCHISHELLAEEHTIVFPIEFHV